MTLDLTAYFDRVDYRGPAEPNLDVLQDLVTAHTKTIPFENLDPLLGVPVDDLSPESLTDKLVRRRRGGYCYEHNGLMGHVLAELGFGVRRLAGRVVWMRPPDAPVPAQTHTMLAVRFPGAQATYLVDVGFGGQTRPRLSASKPVASSKQHTSRTDSTTEATGWRYKRRSAVSGRISTN